MEPILIDTREEYNYVRMRGYEPLTDRRFVLEHGLRVSVQRDIFGTGNHEENNLIFYRWVWDRKRHICEECLKPLEQYSATFVSHIGSRGAFPQFAYDPRNTNILCSRCHAKWENGNRMNMRIYPSNQMIIEQLKKEYETD